MATLEVSAIRISVDIPSLTKDASEGALKDGTRTSKEAVDVAVESPITLENCTDLTGSEPLPPDGGLYAWSTVLGAWLVQFFVVGSMTSFGVTATYYANDFLSNYSSSEINWIGSFQIFIQYLLGLLSGKLFDAGYFRSLSISGSVLFLFSWFMLSLARPQQYYQVFLAQGAGLGISSGLVYTPSVGIVARHFRKRRGLAIGIMTSGDSIGGFFFSTVFGHFVDGKIGFANGIRIGAYLCTGGLIAANLLMRPHPAAHAVTPSRPQDEKRQERPSEPSPTIISVLRQPSYTLVILYGAFFATGLFYPLFTIQLYAQSKSDISDGLTSWLLGIITLTSAFGRIIPNHLSDKYGAIQMSIICSAVSGILVLVLNACTTAPSLVIFCVLYGFFTGGTVALYFPAILALDPDVRTSGLRFGLAQPLMGLAALVGPPIAAALVGHGVNARWWAGFVFSGVMELLSAGLLIAAYLLRGRGNGLTVREGTS